MEDLALHIDSQKIPQHVAIIMDGNGRWARKRGNRRIFGHKNATKAVRETIEGAVQVGLKYITLFTFSTENWSRPQAEVVALMELLIATLKKELPTLLENKIRLNAIGNLDALPTKCYNQLQKSIDKTSTHQKLILTLALSYGGRADILSAAQSLAKKAKAGEINPDEINEEVLSRELSTHLLPDPELIIRTSGEQRISNFLLWESAYAEFYTTETLWPDFNREELFRAIIDYQSRERRFGKISEQIRTI